MDEDKQIQRLFREHEAIRRTLSPPFSRLWQRVLVDQSRHQRPTWPWLPSLVAAGAGITLIVVVLLKLTPVIDGPSVATESLSQWQSPTAFLLDYPGQELYQDVPHLGWPGELPEQNGST